MLGTWIKQIHVASREKIKQSELNKKQSLSVLLQEFLLAAPVPLYASPSLKRSSSECLKAVQHTNCFE